MTQETAAMKEQIRQFVLESLAKSKGVNSLGDAESLVENGVLDSLGIFRLVAFLEDAFRVRIADEEITHENFQSIDAIEQFVLAHTAR
jgi:acyl carrier protein